jgi:hypothetical protein
MSTLPIAAVAAASSTGRHSLPDPVGMWCAIAFGLVFGLFALAMALTFIRDVCPTENGVTESTWRVCFCSTRSRSSWNSTKTSHGLRAHVHNWFRRKQYIGWTFVVVRQDESHSQVKVDKTWWSAGHIYGSFPVGGVVNISTLLLNGVEPLPAGGWFVTNERWVTVQEDMRAEQQRRQAAQHPNITQEEWDALALLGLTTTATRKDVVDARNRLLKVNHPDRGGSTAKAQRINAAYDLINSAFRQAA